MEVGLGARLRLRKIGQGASGSVLEIRRTTLCLKKVATEADLERESHAGRHLCFYINEMAWKFLSEREGTRSESQALPRVPHYSAEDCTPAQMADGAFLCLERIPPVLHSTRAGLIKRFLRPEDQAAARADPKNKDCLCKIYLGNKTTDMTAHERADELSTMRDFPLHLDQIFDLGLGAADLAKAMARGLAAGHWVAHMDMKGVDYVIGGRQRDPSSDAYYHAPLQLWMLDFDKVAPLDNSVDADKYLPNIRRLVAATRATGGPYYPRVLARTEDEWYVWVDFCRTYIETSTILLEKIRQFSSASGFGCPQETVDLVMRRPKLVMDEWMEAECQENGLSRVQFLEIVRHSGWELP